MSSPRPGTEAGRALLDGFAPAPLPEAQELHRRSAQGRRDKLTGGILAIEHEVIERAVAVLGTLTEDDCMYDRPVAQSGEPMDPVLFVRWDAVEAALRSLEEGK